jgi:hypothetical protein
VAATVVDSASGAALSATAVTVSFPSAATDDVVVFIYACDFKLFGNGDWLANTGWTAPHSYLELTPPNGVLGFHTHVVAPGETSWSPVNDMGNNVAGQWWAYLVRGAAYNNCFTNNFKSQCVTDPNCCPGQTGGLFFNVGAIAIAGTVGYTATDSETWIVDLITGTEQSLQVAYRSATDATDFAGGKFVAGDSEATVMQFAILGAPGPAVDSTYIAHFESTCPDNRPIAGHLAFDTSFTPAAHSGMLVVAVGPDLFDGPSSVPAGWTSLVVSSGLWVAWNPDLGASPGTSYDLGANVADSNFNIYIYELSDVIYQGSANGGASSPDYKTPTVTSDVGPTLCIYATGVTTGSSGIWPQYGIDEGTPDGCVSSSQPFAGGNYVGSIAHELTRAGGSGGASYAGTSSGIAAGATIVFSLGPVPCPVAPPATVLGSLAPKTIPEARLSVYNADGSVNKIEVRDDLAGGAIQYEDTPSGCGSATLNLGIFWEDMVTPGGSLLNAYWLGRNIVEISSYDDVIQADITSGATKIYVGSRAAYDPAYGHVDTPQLILDDGINVTYRIPVTGVGTDGGGDYVTIGDPLSYPGGPAHVPAYAAGTKIFRRRYTGLIMRRGLWNSRVPQGQISCTGLAKYLNEAVGTFTINIDEVGNAIYNSIDEFVGRWPQLVIDSANFPYTAQAYSGSNQQYTLADEITQILSGGVTNGDTWVVRVGHDWTVRLLRLYSQSCLAYDYNVTLKQGVKHYEAQFVQGADEDVSNFYNSIEVTGDTNSVTKQPYGAIVQDAESIALFGQVDGVPISNTSCKSDSDCALYAQALLNDNAIPRNNYQVQVFTYTDAIPSGAGVATPMGLTRGDAILGVHNIKIENFEGAAPNINGLCMSVVTTMNVKTGDTWQVAKFAQIEPNWNQAVKERVGQFAITLRHNVLPPASVQSYMVGPFANQLRYTSTSLTVKIGGSAGFQAVFDYGSGLLTIPQTTLTLPASTTAYVFLDNAGTFHIQGGNPIPADSTWMLHTIFQTSSIGIVGHIFKAPQGALGTGGSGGPGSGSVTEIDQGTGIELTPNPITGAGSVALAKIATQTLLANIGGGTDYPSGSTLSAILDAILGSGTGKIIYRSSSGWTSLTIGSTGEVLTVVGGLPSWAAAGGGGTIGYGPSFPGSPSDGELWFRTDLRGMFMWLASSPGPGWFSDQSLSALEDVTLSSPANLDYLQYNGSVWVNTPLTVPTIGSLPTAGSSYRGRIVKVLGSGSGTADAFYICRMRQDGSYKWTRFQGRSVILTFASGEFTPSATGKDVIVREVPYDPEEPGSPTVIAWTVVDIVFRVETAASSGTTSLKVQRSTGTGVFSNVGYLNTTSLDITSGNYEPASGQKPCPLAVTSINSGDKLSPEYTAIGSGSAGYSAYVVLRES